MGLALIVVLIINPVIWLVLQCRRSVRITVGVLTWLFLMWYLGDLCKSITGQTYHVLHLIISAIFFAFAKFMSWITDLGYGRDNREDTDEDDNLITSPSNFWHPLNIWHQKDDE